MLVKQYANADENIVTFVNRLLRDEILTEANTDKLIDMLMSYADDVKLPFWVPKAFILGIMRKILDQMLPGRLLAAISVLLINRFDTPVGQPYKGLS